MALPNGAMQRHGRKLPEGKPEQHRPQAERVFLLTHGRPPSNLNLNRLTDFLIILSRQGIALP